MLITSKDNGNIKILSKLLSNKKFRNEMGVFVVEGMRNCVDVLKQSQEGKTQIKWVFYTEDSIENYKKNFDVSCVLDLEENKKFCITKEIADRISLEENNQGIFVVAEKLDLEFSLKNLNPKGKYVVLNHLQDPGNIGTLLRTADAVGADGVVLTGNCCDLYNPKVVRSAMGSMGRVNIFVEDDFSCVCDTFSKLEIRTLAAVIKDGVSVTEYDFDKPCAVVVGNEGNGLSQNDADLCDDKITITMKGNIDSLNAAVAGAIILWEMFR